MLYVVDSGVNVVWTEVGAVAKIFLVAKDFFQTHLRNEMQQPLFLSASHLRSVHGCIFAVLCHQFFMIALFRNVTIFQ